jgi:hypothetical protein
LADVVPRGRDHPWDVKLPGQLLLLGIAIAVAIVVFGALFDFQHALAGIQFPRW